MRFGLILACLTVLPSCDKPATQQTSSPPPVVSGHPINPKIEVNTTPDVGKVHFDVITNIPLPVVVAADVALMGQKDEDVFIGTDAAHITLNKPETSFDLSTLDPHGKRLPAGKYQGEVSFYPGWGARNEAAKEMAKTEAVSAPFRLENSSLSSEQAQSRNEQRHWVMENVAGGTPWNRAVFVAKLGKYQKSAATLSPLDDAYYFPAPDMTLIVNHHDEVVVWRDGRASR